MFLFFFILHLWSVTLAVLVDRDRGLAAWTGIFTAVNHLSKVVDCWNMERSGYVDLHLCNAYELYLSKVMVAGTFSMSKTYVIYTCQVCNVIPP